MIVFEASYLFGLIVSYFKYYDYDELMFKFDRKRFTLPSANRQPAADDDLCPQVGNPSTSRAAQLDRVREGQIRCLVLEGTLRNRKPQIENDLHPGK